MKSLARLAAVALVLAVGGCAARGPAESVGQVVYPTSYGPMPLAMGDSVGRATFTTRQSLAARNLDGGPVFAGGVPSSD